MDKDLALILFQRIIIMAQSGELSVQAWDAFESVKKVKEQPISLYQAFREMANAMGDAKMTFLVMPHEKNPPSASLSVCLGERFWLQFIFTSYIPDAKVEEGANASRMDTPDSLYSLREMQVQNTRFSRIPLMASLSEIRDEGPVFQSHTWAKSVRAAEQVHDGRMKSMYWMFEAMSDHAHALLEQRFRDDHSDADHLQKSTLVVLDGMVTASKSAVTLLP